MVGCVPVVKGLRGFICSFTSIQTAGIFDAQGLAPQDHSRSRRRQGLVFARRFGSRHSALSTVPCGRDASEPSPFLRLNLQTVVDRFVGSASWPGICPVGEPATGVQCPRPGRCMGTWDKHHKRKPLLSLRLSGLLLLLRYAQRALSGLLFQEPPRNTRRFVIGWPHRQPCRHDHLPGFA